MKQVKGANDIRLDELAVAVDGTVDMALSGKVHDRVGLVFCKDRVECSRIAEVDLLEAIVRVVGEIGEGLGITRIGEFIEVDDRFAFFLNKKANEIGSDKAGTSGDENFHKSSSGS